MEPVAVAVDLMVRAISLVCQVVPRPLVVQQVALVVNLEGLPRLKGLAAAFTKQVAVVETVVIRELIGLAVTLVAVVTVAVRLVSMAVVVSMAKMAPIQHSEVVQVVVAARTIPLPQKDKLVAVVVRIFTGCNAMSMYRGSLRDSLELLLFAGNAFVDTVFALERLLAHPITALDALDGL